MKPLSSRGYINIITVITDIIIDVITVLARVLHRAAAATVLAGRAGGPATARLSRRDAQQPVPDLSFIVFSKIICHFLADFKNVIQKNLPNNSVLFWALFGRFFSVTRAQEEDLVAGLDGRGVGGDTAMLHIRQLGPLYSFLVERESAGDFVNVQLAHSCLVFRWG